jgi:hypothetical protein
MGNNLIFFDRMLTAMAMEDRELITFANTA